MAAREIRFATNRKPFEVGFGPDCEDPSTTLRLGRARVRGADDLVLDARLVGGSAAVDLSGPARRTAKAGFGTGWPGRGTPGGCRCWPCTASAAA